MKYGEKEIVFLAKKMSELTELRNSQEDKRNKVDDITETFINAQRNGEFLKGFGDPLLNEVKMNVDNFKKDKAIINDIKNRTNKLCTHCLICY